MSVALADAIQQVAQLSPEEQQEVLATIGTADQRTRNTLWLLVVGAFTLVLVTSFGVLAYGMFKVLPVSASVKPELILSMFTSVVGFLAGLFAPSPMRKAE